MNVYSSNNFLTIRLYSMNTDTLRTWFWHCWSLSMYSKLASSGTPLLPCSSTLGTSSSSTARTDQQALWLHSFQKKKKTRRRPVEPVALRSSHRQQGPVAWLHAHLRNNWEPKVFKPLASPILLKQMQQIQVLKLYSKYCCILSVS